MVAMNTFSFTGVGYMNLNAEGGRGANVSQHGIRQSARKGVPEPLCGMRHFGDMTSHISDFRKAGVNAFYQE